jgi:hypothetical protein
VCTTACSQDSDCQTPETTCDTTNSVCLCQ